MARYVAIVGGTVSSLFGAQDTLCARYSLREGHFCTSRSEIVAIKGGVVDDIETQMMTV